MAEAIDIERQHGFDSYLSRKRNAFIMFPAPPMPAAETGPRAVQEQTGASLQDLLEERAGLDQIQAAYNSNPSALTHHVIRNVLKLAVCPSKAKILPFPEGVIPFLMDNFQDFPAGNYLFAGIANRKDILDGILTEDNLKPLVSKFIKSMQQHGDRRGLLHCLKIIFQEAQNRFSNHFLDFFAPFIASTLTELKVDSSCSPNSIFPGAFRGLSVLLQSPSLTTLSLDLTDSCDYFDAIPIINCIMQSTSLTEVNFKLTLEGLDLFSRDSLGNANDNDLARMIRMVVNMENNSSIKTFFVDNKLLARDQHQLYAQIFLSMARKMDALSCFKFENFLSTNNEGPIGNYARIISELANLIRASETLQSLELLDYSAVQKQILFELSDALIASTSLTTVIIRDLDPMGCANFDTHARATEVFQRVLYILQENQRIHTFSINNYWFRQKPRRNNEPEIDPSWMTHDLLLEIEFICAERRNMPSAVVPNCTQIVDAIYSAMTDDLITPQYQYRGHKENIVTSVVFAVLLKHPGVWATSSD